MLGIAARRSGGYSRASTGLHREPAITSAETRRPYLKRHARERADSDPYARACHFHELDPGMVTFTPTDAQTVFPLTGTCAAEIAR